MNEEQMRAEREYIEMEAARIDSSERYFNIRPQIDCRKVFESGFDRGWKAALDYQAKIGLLNQASDERARELESLVDCLLEADMTAQLNGGGAHARHTMPAILELRKFRAKHRAIASMAGEQG